MLFGKFVMARMHYSGRTPGNNFHPYKPKTTYDLMKITSEIYPPSKWQNCGQIPPTILLGVAGKQLTRISKWQLIVICSTGRK
jgi:hypothetical protein